MIDSNDILCAQCMDTHPRIVRAVYFSWSELASLEVEESCDKISTLVIMSSAVDQFPAALFQGRIALKLAQSLTIVNTPIWITLWSHLLALKQYIVTVCNILHLTPILYHVCNGYIGLLVQLMTLYQADVFNIIVQLNELETSCISNTLVYCIKGIYHLYSNITQEISILRLFMMYVATNNLYQKITQLFSLCCIRN